MFLTQTVTYLFPQLAYTNLQVVLTGTTFHKVTKRLLAIKRSDCKTKNKS